MIRQEVRLSKVKWQISILYNCSKKDTLRILEILEQLTPSRQIVRLVQESFISDKDIGFIYCNFQRKHSVIMLSESTSEIEAVNTLSHEIIHLAWQISLIYNIKDEEALATIIGELSKEIYKVAKALLYSVNKDIYNNY